MHRKISPLIRSPCRPIAGSMLAIRCRLPWRLHIDREFELRGLLDLPNPRKDWPSRIEQLSPDAVIDSFVCMTPSMPLRFIAPPSRPKVTATEQFGKLGSKVATHWRAPCSKAIRPMSRLPLNLIPVASPALLRIVSGALSVCFLPRLFDRDARSNKRPPERELHLQLTARRRIFLPLAVCSNDLDRPVDLYRFIVKLSRSVGEGRKR